MKRIAVFIVMLCIMVPAVQGLAWDFYDGNTLLYDLEGRNNKNVGYVFETGASAYIGGIASLLSETQIIKIPQNVNLKELVDIVHVYLQNNPKFRHFSGTSIVTTALKESFPPIQK